MAFICGTGSFSHHADDDPWSPSSHRGSRSKQGGNPYSERGLDKFSVVLADLEARREKILAAAGSQRAAIVRFVYSNSQDWVPIVVTAREPRTEGKPRKGRAAEAARKRPGGTEEPPSPPPPPEPRAGSGGEGPAVARAVKKCSSWRTGEGSGLWPAFRWKPSYYVPAAVVLILLCLAAFGRAFAICCTSIWWYAAPALRGSESQVNVRKSMKKDYRRRASNKMLGPAAAACSGGDAPASAQGRREGGLDGLASPRRHQHQARGKTTSW